MARILTGIQSTGIPHLGNILGAIIPAIKKSETKGNESFLFIADLHSLTQIKNADELKKNTLYTAAAWLSFGLDTKKTVFYKQSDIPEVTELAWYLSCFYPYQRLTLSHSFKDKSQNLKDINSGLFNYPVLMAADILLYDANIVPVGKDQLQHLEITRNIASRFNKHFGDTFINPKADLEQNSNYVIGTDGNKMSKSKNNIINIFQDDNLLEKQVMRIKTESIAINEPKNVDNCNVFKIFSLVADEKDISILKRSYAEGSVGFGEAKKILLNVLKNKFKVERDKFNFLVNNPELVENELKTGSRKARNFANKVLSRVRLKLGYNK
ncbi:MAG: tryptophan--tRNA ligase [Flavobacteriaceae bacterium]|tara:strand:+ start:16467 stop:17441 length:975 start_codon:yes stop_codon:yes gene_type:complete